MFFLFVIEVNFFYFNVFFIRKKKEMYMLNKYLVDLVYVKDEWYFFVFFRVMLFIIYFKYFLGFK